jgi:hypothetical protein
MFVGLIGLLSVTVALIAVGFGLVISGVAGDAETGVFSAAFFLGSALFNSSASGSDRAGSKRLDPAFACGADSLFSLPSFCNAARPTSPVMLKLQNV